MSRQSMLVKQLIKNHGIFKPSMLRDDSLNQGKSRLARYHRDMAINLRSFYNIVRSGNDIDVSNMLCENSSNGFGFASTTDPRRPYVFGMRIGRKVLRYDPWEGSFLKHDRRRQWIDEQFPTAQHIRHFESLYRDFSHNFSVWLRSQKEDLS